MGLFLHAMEAYETGADSPLPGFEVTWPEANALDPTCLREGIAALKEASAVKAKAEAKGK